MNILILSWRGPGHPNEGGAEIATHEYAKAWVRKGHSVTLFTSYYRGAQRKEFIEGVEIIRRGAQTFGVHIAAFIWYVFGDHKRYDLVIDQFHGIPFFTPLYVRSKKMVLIHEVAKEVWQYNQYPFPLNLFVASIGFRVEPHIFKLYRKIHFMTISKSTKADLIDWGIHKKNITIVYNGVSKPQSFIFKKNSRKTITFLGALTKDKGIEVAIDTFHYLNKNYKTDFQFWIIGKGEGWYVKYLKKRVDQLTLNRVKFWGYVSEEQKFILLGKSHVLINPSVREGWGLVVIEAAEVGTPTVAFDVPGLRDSIINNKTGMLSKQYSVAGLGDKIHALISNKDKYQQICQEAILWGNKFSWHKATNESFKLIAKLTKK